MHTDVPAGFEPVQAVRSLLSSLAVPWWVTGGWAIDLAVGQVTRPHEDVDVVLLERDEHALRRLPGVGLQLVVGPDHQEQPWTAGRRMLAGPDSVRLISSRLPLPTQVLFTQPWALPGCITGVSPPSCARSARRAKPGTASRIWLRRSC